MDYQTGLKLQEGDWRSVDVMDHKDLTIQELRAKNKKLAEELEAYKERGILPPCKVGDTIYVIGVLGDFENAEECRVINIHYHTSDLQTVFRCDAICKKFNVGYLVGVKVEDIGKTVFLTEQEAQSVLEKMKGE